jgi:cell volume regulation protein A
MFEGMYLLTLVSTMLVLIAAFSSLLAFRFGAPLLLLFLGIGLAAGVDGLGIPFDNASAAYFIGSLALAIILFDSGFGTSFQAFRQAAYPAIVLATFGVVLTTVIFGVAAYYLLGFGWLESFLLGAIVGSTDAAAVFFLLRIGGINIRDKVRSTLEIESSSNDPMAIFLTIALVEIIATGAGMESIGIELAGEFLLQMGVGMVAGIAGGAMIVGLVNRLDMERGLTPIFVLALSLLVFAVTGALGGSGFLAVYVAGLYAGNRNIRAAPILRRFQDGTTWLAQIIMFLVLGLLATPSQFPEIAVPAILLALFLSFIARPLAVWISLLPFSYQRQETAFISWVGLRGAVSILLAIVPLLGGLENASALFNVAFIIVLVSLLLQGWTINPLARRLGLVVPSRVGPVDKVELELPGTANHELLAYRVVANSPVAKGERVPRWARPSLVIRDGQSMRYQYAGRLREGDYVYLFISPRYPRLLDRLFASPATVEGDDADFFGAFTIDPTRPARDLQLAYGPELGDAELDLTIAELMKARLGGRAEYADRVGIGPVELIVREVDEEGEIVSIGVSLEPDESAPPKLPMFQNLREIKANLRAWVRRRKDRRKVGSGEAGVQGPDGTVPAAGQTDSPVDRAV